MRKVLTASFCVLVVTACATSRNPVPKDLVAKASVPGFENARYWGDELPPHLDQLVAAKVAQTRAKRLATGKDGVREVAFLSLSGGSSNGAFGAGLLVGWTASRARPQFEVVTGVSTGALIAPFAFLGPDYDGALTEVYTKYATSDLMRKRVITGMIAGSSIADSAPLAKLIAHYVDGGFLEAVAREHEKGRRLLVATTNLDAQRPMIWDMGEIARRRSPEALELFRRVLLASASVPGMFPPILVKVRAGGELREEMHVDGGATSEVFLFPSRLMLAPFDDRNGVQWRRTIYVVRNGRLGPEWQAVEARTMSIASRSIETLIKSQSVGDLYRLYTLAQRNQMEFRLASVPNELPDTSEELFDQAYMRQLFDQGFKLGSQGYRWQTAPPGLD